MYGSSLMLVTRRPRASMSAPMEAAARPFPMELTTPPVTKMYFVGLEFMASSARRRTTVNAEKPHGVWGFSGTSAPFGENLGRGFRPESSDSRSAPFGCQRAPRAEVEIAGSGPLFSAIWG